MPAGAGSAGPDARRQAVGHTWERCVLAPTPRGGKGVPIVPAAIVFRFGRPWAGREKLAFEAFQDALAFFGKLAVDGLCQSPIPYMVMTGGGLLIVHGERDRLLEILAMEDFGRMYLKAGYTVPDLTFEIVTAGEAAVESMGMWAGVGSELGLA